MDLKLDREDGLLLQRVLERSLADLRSEIAKTENFEWRQSMHQDEERLKAILSQLAAVTAV